MVTMMVTKWGMDYEETRRSEEGKIWQPEFPFVWIDSPSLPPSPRSGSHHWFGWGLVDGWLDRRVGALFLSLASHTHTHKSILGTFSGHIPVTGNTRFGKMMSYVNLCFIFCCFCSLASYPSHPTLWQHLLLYSPSSQWWSPRYTSQWGDGSTVELR